MASDILSGGMRATGRNVVVKFQPQRKITASGIYLLEQGRGTEWIGRVLSVGAECREAKGLEGRWVALDRHGAQGKRLTGSNIENDPDDTDEWFGPENEILAVLEGEPDAEA